VCGFSGGSTHQRCLKQVEHHDGQMNFFSVSALFCWQNCFRSVLFRLSFVAIIVVVVVVSIADYEFHDRSEH